MIELLLRSIFALLFLQLLTRWGGPKQISQLSYYDYIVGISVGNIASEIAINEEMDISKCAFAMFLFVAYTILQAYLTTKSISLRKLLTGTPLFVIYEGKIIEKNMKKAHYDINDLLSECRANQIFDIKKIQHAIIEPSGKLSILLKTQESPPSAKDIQCNVQQELLFINVIIDGKVLQEELQTIKQNEAWLQAQIHPHAINDILLAIADTNNHCHYYLKNETMQTKDYFV